MAVKLVVMKEERKEVNMAIFEQRVLLDRYSLLNILPFLNGSNFVTYLDAFSQLREASCLLDIVEACNALHDIMK